MHDRKLIPVVLAAFLPVLGGCQGWGYIATVVQGELQVQLQARPIEEVLAGGTLSAEDQRKLELIVQVRDFAGNQLGLTVGDSYSMFYDSGDQAVAYNLSGASRSALIPYYWQLPIVGAIPYLGFYDLDQALAERDNLQAQGLDTYLYEVDAYSTLGILRDPVKSSMLRRSDVQIIDTVIHEVTHNTVWRAGDTDFDESLATFVGRTGARIFIEQTFGSTSELLIEADHNYADTRLYNAFMADLYDRLSTYYGGPETDEEKAAGREAIFQAARDRFRDEVYPLLNNQAGYQGVLNLPTNNAWILLNRRYNLDLDLFQQVYEASGNNIPAALQVFGQAAQASDAKVYLRDWLAAQSQPAS
jgi:predicted aminopeptidase